MSGLFQNVINLTPVISIMILAVILMRIVFSNAPKRINKILWAIIGIRCLLPVSFSVSVGVLPDKTVPYTLSNQGIKSTGIIRPDIILPAVNPGSESISKSFSLKEVFPYIWIVGLVLFLAYMILSYIRGRMLVSDAIPCGGKIYEAYRISSSFVMGLFRPRIYLKSGATNENRDLIIAHERCHIKHKDNFFKLISFIILGVYWFNPLMWVAYFLFCKDIELACDEEVIKQLSLEERKDYAIALLESSNKKGAFIYGTAFSENDTKERIISVMNYKKPKFWVVCIAIVACVGFLAVFFTVNKGDSTAANADYTTYEFETFDGENVVINSDNIVLQEKSEDPESSEHISSEAAGNIIAPGRDYVYLADEDYYYVADYSNGLITVANKTEAENVDTADETADSPGAFETESFSIKYDTQNFFGYEDGDSVVLNNTNAVAGSSLIQISVSNSTTVEDAINEIASTTGFELSKPEKYDLNGYSATKVHSVIDEDGDEASVIVDDMYTLVENNGKVIVIDEMVTRDNDADRSKVLEIEFEDAISNLEFK